MPYAAIRPGESPQATALHVVQKEASITAEIEGLIGIQYLMEDLPVFAFLCRHVSGVPTPGTNKIDRVACFSLEGITTSNESIDFWCKGLARGVLSGEYRATLPEADNPRRLWIPF